MKKQELHQLLKSLEKNDWFRPNNKEAKLSGGRGRPGFGRPGFPAGDGFGRFLRGRECPSIWVLVPWGHRWHGVGGAIARRGLEARLKLPFGTPSCKMHDKNSTPTPSARRRLFFYVLHTIMGRERERACPGRRDTCQAKKLTSRP